MDTDYKKLYLEQRIISIQIELGALQLRHEKLLQELPVAQKELAEYQTKE